MTPDVQRGRTATLVCPVCKRPMLSPAERCSGSFLDADHPASVPPVEAKLSERVACCKCGQPSIPVAVLVANDGQRVVCVDCLKTLTVDP